MKITVYKFNPATDAEPYYVSGEVPYTKDMSALHALKLFNENVAQVNYDYSCRGRLCGRCAMMVNGEPTLICTKRLAEDRDYTFEPLPGFPVYRDLIVDKSRAHAKLAQVYERVRIEPIDAATLNTFDMTHHDDILDMEHCCRCQVCTAGCPVKAIDPSYIGPSQMLAIAYRHFDPYDQADRLVEAVQGGLWKCTLCGTCDQNCGAIEIEHVEIWKKLRAEAEARGLKPANA